MRYLVLGMLLIGAGSLEARVDREKATPGIQAITVEDAMTTLLATINQPAPATLSKGDRAAYQKQTEWLTSVLTRLEVVTGVTIPRDAASGLATGKRQHKPILMTRELVTLVATVETESQQDNALSNALQARHDIAMNAIRNMK